MYDPVPHRRMDQQVRQWIVDVLVACGDKRWMHYLRRVGTELGLDLSSEQHSTLATIPLNAACQADIVVSAFAVPKPSAAQPIVSS